MAFFASQTSDPKRGFRFLLSIGGIPAYTIKTVSKPGVTVSTIEHQFLNHTFRYPGRTTWDSPISVTLVDPVDPDVARTLLNKIKNAGYVYPTDPFSSQQSMTKDVAVNTLEGCVIEQLSGDGTTAVERWELKNAFLSKVTYGDLDYGSEDLSQITIEITYDWAELRESGPVDPSQAVREDRIASSDSEGKSTARG
tara:strand:- start:12 stop:599 length:588 start_codon:yes stop_codon:yes gene_type:complete